MEKAIYTQNLTFFPLTVERWDDFTTLFGAHGASGGCWCMFWRISRKDFSHNSGEENKHSMAEAVKSGIIPGILGYKDKKAITWCSIAPRDDFAALERSHTLKRVDERPVWSIVCFFTDRSTRNTGLMEETIRGAVEYARRNGAKLVEAYPSEVIGHHQPVDLYMGNLKTFTKAGFKEVARRGSHVIVRYEL